MMLLIVWMGCVVLAFAAFATWFGLTVETRASAEPDDARPGGRGTGYERVDRLADTVRAALRDGRYFARVLAPQLCHLAHDIAAHRTGRHVSDADLARALGPPAWTLLDSPPRDRDEPPSADELARILAGIEDL